jgi:CBS domain-containing protein
MWARVAGDAIDVAALASGRRGPALGALAAVGAVTALDVLCATRLGSRPPAPPVDYTGRSGFPLPPQQMRGAARSDFTAPRDMRTPAALRPWREGSDSGAARARTAADAMTRGVRAMSPQDSVQLAAQAMEQLNVGVIPVCEVQCVVGVVTDRDIAVRGVAQGLRLEQTPLRDVMSTQIECVREHDALAVAAAKMERSQVRRLPVLDAQDHLVGMLSLGDLAIKGTDSNAGRTLAGISEPAQPDRSVN